MKVLTIVAVIFVMLVAYGAFKNMRVPEGLGVSDGRLAPVPSSPNAVSSQTDEVKKKVAPLAFKLSLAESVAAIDKALKEYGNIKIIKRDAHYIHAVATTGIMRFNDDLEFYFDEASQMIHFRSASRLGYSDMGLNRKRYERIAELYAQ